MLFFSLTQFFFPVLWGFLGGFVVVVVLLLFGLIAFYGEVGQNSFQLLCVLALFLLFFGGVWGLGVFFDI